MIVPATRGVDSETGEHALTAAARLAARVDATLVALCSYQASADDAAEVFRAEGCRGIAVNVPPHYRHRWIPTRTESSAFDGARAKRTSDLSVKRNLGLLLARQRGWRKVLFLDDDIGFTVSGRRQIALKDSSARRLAVALESYQVAGFACRRFPDHSVVWHAMRMTGSPLKNFVSGAALGVNCADRPLPLFPDGYNEDWFFFSQRAAAGEIAYLGDAIQKPYDPFADPMRARQEEFGDLLAEGLYALFESQPEGTSYEAMLAAADEKYWAGYIEERRGLIRQTTDVLRKPKPTRHSYQAQPADAVRSLDAAEAQLKSITPRVCVQYLKAWTRDLNEWQRRTQRIHEVGTTTQAMRNLKLRDWREEGHGAALPASVR